jgi:hypothetical protein
MSKGLKITVIVLLSYLSLSTLHIWLNIGLDKFMPGFLVSSTARERASLDKNKFRVGFLPVT